MNSRYMPILPRAEVDPSLKAFISNFYELSDLPDKNEDWVGLFEDDATLIIGHDRGEGKDDIFKIRQGMWETVASRKHTVVKAFPATFGEPGVVDYMLFGTVDYVLKAGGETSVDWAGYASVRGDGQGGWKFKYYRVYLQT